MKEDLQEVFLIVFQFFFFFFFLNNLKYFLVLFILLTEFALSLLNLISRYGRWS